MSDARGAISKHSFLPLVTFTSPDGHQYVSVEAFDELAAKTSELQEQYQTALRAVDAARVILTLADEERDELAGEVSKYLGPWADLVEAVHAVLNPASSPNDREDNPDYPFRDSTWDEPSPATESAP